MILIMECTDPFGKGCRWTGDDGELVAKEGEDDFIFCPNCGGNDFHEEEEEEEEDIEDEEDQEYYEDEEDEG